MTAPAETAHTTVVQRQWALRKAAAGRQHRKVVDGQFTVYSVEAPPALDVVMATEKHRAEEAAANAPLAPGQQTADGVCAGLTSDGKQQIFTMPKALDVLMTFNDAAKAVEKLNADKALGHDDWQIPSLENLRVLKKNQNEAALKGTFDKSSKGTGSDSGYPGWYWSSTEVRVNSSYVHGVRFSDGGEGWYLKDNDRLSCRPVRLVAASSAPALG
jgi:hypothetical protein